MPGDVWKLVPIDPNKPQSEVKIPTTNENQAVIEEAQKNAKEKVKRTKRTSEQSVTSVIAGPSGLPGPHCGRRAGCSDSDR